MSPKLSRDCWLRARLTVAGHLMTDAVPMRTEKS
ncbi:hypothetical protein ARSEF4850_009193 [Beauveria asiatica]